jgi:photosystem II stability/assembly factor-like uncharacterized protein
MKRYGILAGALALAACVATSTPAPAGSSAPTTSGAPASATVLPTPVPNSNGRAIDALGATPSGAIWTTEKNHLSISADLGQTWARVVMPAASPLSFPAPLFVLDPRHIWFVTTTPDSSETGNGPRFDHAQVLVTRTTDGGATWMSSPIAGDYPDTARAVAFADTRHGYVMISGGRTNAGSSTVARSDDGGATWSVVRTVPADASGDLGSQIATTDASTLWAAAQAEAGPVIHPILDVSRDAGKTWSPAGLPGLGRWGGTNSIPAGPPVFLDAARGFIAVQTSDPAATDDPTEDPYTLVYGTTDGFNWSRVGRLAVAANDVAFLSAESWVVALNSAPALIQATTDAGHTWRPVSLDSPRGYVMTVVAVGSQVVACVSLGGESASPKVLIRSEDGGLTWLPISQP